MSKKRGRKIKFYLSFILIHILNFMPIIIHSIIELNLKPISSGFIIIKY